MSTCPTQNCNTELEHDAILCPDCYLQTKDHLYRFLVRMRLAARRAPKADDRKHLHERYEANLRSICRTIKIPDQQQQKKVAS